MVSAVGLAGHERFITGHWKVMNLLLTSNGIANPNIRDALVDLLGKPIC